MKTRNKDKTLQQGAISILKLIPPDILKQWIEEQKIKPVKAK